MQETSGPITHARLSRRGVLVLEVVDVSLQLLLVVMSQLVDGPLVQRLDLVITVKDGGDGLQRGLSEGLDQVEVYR